MYTFEVYDCRISKSIFWIAGENIEIVYSQMSTKHRRRPKRMMRKTANRKSSANRNSYHVAYKHQHVRCNHVKRDLVSTFMEMLTVIKVYHWNTHSFAQHKATDEIHERLSENIDKFVEVLLGKTESRLTHLNEKIQLIRSKNLIDFKKIIYQYRECMIRLSDCFDSRKDSDLLNIRDEILADLNQLLYLLTLD